MAAIQRRGRWPAVRPDAQMQKTHCQETRSRDSDEDSVEFDLPIQLHESSPEPDDSTRSYEAVVLQLPKGKTEGDLASELRMQAIRAGLGNEVLSQMIDALNEFPAPRMSQVPESPQPGSSRSSSFESTVTSAQSQSTKRTSILSSTNASTTIPWGQEKEGALTKFKSRLSTYTKRLSIHSSTTQTLEEAACVLERTPLQQDLFKIQEDPRAHPSTERRSVLSLDRPRPTPPRSHTRLRAHESHSTLRKPQQVKFAPSQSPISESSSLDSYHPALRRLLLLQSAEKIRFLKHRTYELSGLRAGHGEIRRSMIKSYKTDLTALQKTHESVNEELEIRHLDAELEHESALLAERKASALRLRHMDAYVHGPIRTGFLHGRPATSLGLMKVHSAPVGRVVTEHDKVMLAGQYNLHEGLPQLHEARIKVLREKQSRQAGRVQKKQESECEALMETLRRDLARERVKEEESVAGLKKTWEARKERLIRRWRLQDRIERARLGIGAQGKGVPEDGMSWSSNEQEVAPEVFVGGGSVI